MNDEQPQHLAIIMDGNGRWAKARRFPRIEGHRRGVKVVKSITTLCSDLGLETLTLYAFSKENWSRPKLEVELLMQLLKVYAVKERPTFMKHNIKLQVIGRTEDLPQAAQVELQKSMELTAQNTGMVLQLALNYGGRDEILRAVQKWSKDRANLEVPLTEEVFETFLDTGSQRPPDLLIRTSGEQRISNFLLWQAAYSEFYFTDCLWPDFNHDELMKAFDAYRHRDRRYGGLGREEEEQTIAK